MIDIAEKEIILKEIFDLLGEKYPSGLYEWMYKHSPDACREISELEDKVNDNFRLNGSVRELKAILRAYWIGHMKAIKAFFESDKPDNPSDEFRTERIRELESMRP